MARILVVEDDAMQRDMIGKLLRNQFGDVTVVDQLEAQDVDWCKFDVALVDVMMPLFDGPTVIRKAHEKCGKMPVIILYSALSGDVMNQEIVKLSDIVSAHYIVKSFSKASELAATIREYL